MIKVERLEARDGLTICDECNARVQNAPYYRVYVGVHTDRLCEPCMNSLAEQCYRSGGWEDE